MERHNTETLIVTAFIALYLALDISVSMVANKEAQKVVTPPTATLTHAQEVYIKALEWCESRGVMTAINPNDRDNTPSYYSWQWKPDTFKYFGIKYGIISQNILDKDVRIKMADYETEKLVIEAMVEHRSEIKWSQQFPDCTKKLGNPPR